jgi:hypothetical protein
VIGSLANLILENDLKTECLCVQGWAGSIDIKCTLHALLTLLTLQIILDRSGPEWTIVGL